MWLIKSNSYTRSKFIKNEAEQLLTAVLKKIKPADFSSIGKIAHIVSFWQLFSQISMDFRNLCGKWFRLFDFYQRKMGISWHKINHTGYLNSFQNLSWKKLSLKFFKQILFLQEVSFFFSERILEKDKDCGFFLKRITRS